VREFPGEKEHYLDFGEPAYDAFVGKNPEYLSKQFRYRYSSMTTPLSTYDYAIASKQRNLIKEQPVLGGFKRTDYVTERRFVTARDGVRIPLSIVYKKVVLCMLLHISAADKKWEDCGMKTGSC